MGFSSKNSPLLVLYSVCSLIHMTPYRENNGRAEDHHQLQLKAGYHYRERWGEGNTSTEENVPTPTITAAEVCRELRRFHPSKTAGPDRVSPQLQKACTLEVGNPLQHIFNLSLEHGRVPKLVRKVLWACSWTA